MKPNSKDSPISGKLKITHYECLKDGKVILSSNEPIEAENIDRFKANAKRLIECDTVTVAG